MLFRDQCVKPTTVASMVETDTTITTIGYRVFEGASPITEMRAFKNKGSFDTYIDIQNLISFDHKMFFAYLRTFKSVGFNYQVPSSKKTFSIKTYSIVYTKATAVSVATEIGSVTMNNVIDGKFGNYFPKNMLTQGSSKFVLLTNKYDYKQEVLISRNTHDVITVFCLTGCTVSLRNLAGAVVTSASLAANEMHIISLNSLRWGSALMEYQIFLDGGAGDELTYDVKVSAHIDGLPLGRGGCYREDGENRFNLFIKHPYGGLDNVGNINVTSISGQSNRREFRVQDTPYIHGGSANAFETTTQIGSDFSTSGLPVLSEGSFSYSYEAYMYNVNELWVAAIAASKVGYLVYINAAVETIIDVKIDGISASIEEIEGGLKIWKVSFSVTQKIPFVA